MTDLEDISSSNKPDYRKLIIILFIVLLAVLLVGQFIAAMFTTKFLIKVSGKVEQTEDKITSYTGGGRLSAGKPNYSAVITLKDGKTYDADLHDGDWLVDYSLQKDDEVTIYSPSIAYQILSLDILDFGSRINQLDFNNVTLYKKRHSYSFSLYLIFAIILSCRLLYKISYTEN